MLLIITNNGISDVYNELSMEVGNFFRFLNNLIQSVGHWQVKAKNVRAIKKGYQHKALETERETPMP